MEAQEISEETKAAWMALWEYATGCIDFNDGTIDFNSFMEYGVKEFDIKYNPPIEPARNQSPPGNIIAAGDSYSVSDYFKAPV